MSLKPGTMAKAADITSLVTVTQAARERTERR
jgi:hypothetical protein